ncbi:DNA replication/repair protein RecF [Gardnerella sp. Marseille-Q9181]|nr:DNA replication and repair protein RecF [Gardnerella vaginalis]
MYVSRLVLDHFRSWSNCVLDFSPKINVLFGSNGLGKTNIVEAIEVISTGTSHRISSLMPLIECNNSCATIRLNAKYFDNNDLDETTYELTINSKGANRARINSGKSLYMKDIVGLVKSISFTPRDQNLIFSDPNIRRTFIDQAGALLIPNYLQVLQEYNHIAKQRAYLLKSLSNNNLASSTNGYNPISDLEIWTGKFIESGIILTKNRKKIINLLNEIFPKIVDKLSRSSNFASIQYNPSFEELEVESKEDYFPQKAISEHFQRIYAGEVARGYNLIGPHRDDFTILINNHPAKEFASNGESWTLALALKMALFKTLEEKTNQKPIVILDDVFSQLDESRRKQILEFAKEQEQVFITVASLSDIPKDENLSEESFIDISKIVEKNNTQDEDFFNNNLDSNHKDLLKDIINNRKNNIENNSNS